MFECYNIKSPSTREIRGECEICCHRFIQVAKFGLKFALFPPMMYNVLLRTGEIILSSSVSILHTARCDCQQFWLPVNGTQTRILHTCVNNIYTLLYIISFYIAMTIITVATTAMVIISIVTVAITTQMTQKHIKSF